jgi:hypothetical protein
MSQRAWVARIVIHHVPKRCCPSALCAYSAARLKQAKPST